MNFVKWTENRIVQILSSLQFLLRYLLMISVVIITLETFCRYALSSPHDFSDQLILYIVQFSVLGGAASALYQNKQIRMDLLVSLLKGRCLEIAKIVDYTATLIASSIIAYFSWYYIFFLVHTGAASDTSIEIPYWLGPFAFFVSMILVSLVSLSNLLNALMSRNRRT